MPSTETGLGMQVASSLWSVLAWGGLVAALWQVWRDQRSLPAPAAGAIDRRTYQVLALLGLVITWTFMLTLAVQDIAKYPSVSAWSTQSDLFFDAYRRVTHTTPAWWWSQQLMLWAPGALLFFHAESVRQRLAFWAYAWVGMCVAISVALPLFLLRQEAHTKRAEAPTATLWLVLCMGVALLATATIPWVGDSGLQSCLLALHASVLLALVPVAPRWASTQWLRWAYLLIGGVAMLSWWSVNVQLCLHTADVGAQLWDVIWSDPAQSSISLDLVLTVCICSFWVARQRGRMQGRKAALLFLAAAGLLSLGAAFCFYQWCRLREAG